MFPAHKSLIPPSYLADMQSKHPGLAFKALPCLCSVFYSRPQHPFTLHPLHLGFLLSAHCTSYSHFGFSYCPLNWWASPPFCFLFLYQPLISESFGLLLCEENEFGLSNPKTWTRPQKMLNAILRHLDLTPRIKGKD